MSMSVSESRKLVADAQDSIPTFRGIQGLLSALAAQAEGGIEVRPESLEVLRDSLHLVVDQLESTLELMVEFDRDGAAAKPAATGGPPA